MPTNRKIVFANGQYYHVFNRGLDKRPVFTNKNEFNRAVNLLEYYSFSNLPTRYSKFISLSLVQRNELIKGLKKENQIVAPICYCFMNNHFHFLLRQETEHGVSKFMANFTNSYTKYFAVKHKRNGPLFQGLFKAVRIETDEQLVHISRYIHLNPLTGYLIKPEELRYYFWSSYPTYLNRSDSNFLHPEIILGFYSDKRKYESFVLDQVDYARKLKEIEHLSIDLMS